ncbi:AAA family ATPase [Vibrio parahaemolyticus]
MGKNGSGKSSIARLIPLIIESIYKEELEFCPKGLDLGGRLTDIVTGNSISKPLSLGLEFELENQKFTFETSLVSDIKSRRVIISNFTYQDEQGQLTFIKDTDSQNSDSYLQDDNSICIKFAGLLPNLESINNEKVRHRLAPLNKLKSNIHSQYLNYLGPFRSTLQRVFPAKDYFSSNTGIDGKEAPYIVFTQANNPDSKFINEINSWMHESMDASGLEVQKDSESFSIKISKNNLKTNIIDHGIGFSQILPLITNRFSRKSDNIHGFEIVEQPELHIHPSMCGSIIDLYLTILNEEKNTCVLETHSKETILRLRRRVAESKGDMSSRVQLIYVDQNDDGSFIDYIKILEDGSCSWWPQGVFEEAYDEVIAIEEAKHAS